MKFLVKPTKNVVYLSDCGSQKKPCNGKCGGKCNGRCDSKGCTIKL